MKNFTQPLLKKMALAACLVITGGATASAANFVAVASGNFTSAATWGGTAPSTNITGDNITIPLGVTVTLNQDVAISGASSSLNIAGELLAAASEDLSITGGAALTGVGNLQVDSLTIGGVSASLGYAGNILVRAFTSLGLTVNSGATITATEKVRLSAGVLDLLAVNISLNNGGTVYMSGGSLNVGGSANLNLNTYNVVYTDVSAATGLELSGMGLAEVHVSVPASATVSLSSDLDMTDTLYLSSGMLALNGNDLSFSGNGNVAASGTGTISTTSASNIMINSSNNFAGSLRFTPGLNNVNNFTVNFGSSSASASLASDLNVNGTLSLQSGKLDIGSNEIVVDAGGSVTGGSASSYVATDLNGSLTMAVSAGNTGTFMIGTSANFAPIAVKVNTGSTGGNISAGVKSGLQAGVNTGANLAATQPVVNATWFVGTDASSNVNMDISPMWSPSLEVNGFNRAEAFVSANTNGTWDVVAASAATAATAGMYTMTRANVSTSGTAVAVMDKDAVNGITEVATDNGMKVYPNPVVNTLYFKSGTALRTPVSVNIYDVTGHLVKSTVADNNNSVSVAELPAGFYTAQFSSNEYKAIAKFVKQ